MRRAVVLSILSTAVGCQSHFTIRVERLAGVSHAGLADPDAALAVVGDVLAGLDAVCTECRSVTDSTHLAPALAGFAAAQAAAQPLRPRLAALLAQRAQGSIAPQAFADGVETLRREARAIIARLSPAEVAAAAEPDTAKRAALERLAARVSSELSSYASRLDSAGGAVGFGGFAQPGLYRINPGDPSYEAVLKAAPSAMPLTEVRIAATGDSSVMIVQESPAQVRLYQIANDPVPLMRNVSFILDKIMQGAIKYAAPIP